MTKALPLFNAYAFYYDMFYREKDYDSEALYLKSLLTRHGVQNGELLEFGSGTGKHGRLLAAHGYKVHGIELSAEMVSKAEAIPGFTCQQGDIACVTMGRLYDAVLSLFHVISYQTGKDKLHAVFANAAKHLNSDGLFIFDFWYSPAVFTQKPAVRVRKIVDENIEITRIAEPVIYSNKNRVDVNYTIYVRNLKSNEAQVLQETHPMRHFSLPEIEILADLNNFDLILAEEFLTANPPSEKTWGVCVVLRKRINNA